MIEAVTSGTLYKLLNFGPQQVILHVLTSEILDPQFFQFSGLPIKAEEFEEMVEQMLAGLGPGPSVPFLGPVKSLLVDHRTLGALAGRARERLVNRFLARRLSTMMAASQTLIKVRQGETLVSSSLPPVSLGTPCDNEVNIPILLHLKLCLARCTLVLVGAQQQLLEQASSPPPPDSPSTPTLPPLPTSLLMQTFW